MDNEKSKPSYSNGGRPLYGLGWQQQIINPSHWNTIQGTHFLKLGANLKLLHLENHLSHSYITSFLFFSQEEAFKNHSFPQSIRTVPNTNCNFLLYDVNYAEFSSVDHIKRLIILPVCTKTTNLCIFAWTIVVLESQRKKTLHNKWRKKAPYICS